MLLQFHCLETRSGSLHRLRSAHSPQMFVCSGIIVFETEQLEGKKTHSNACNATLSLRYSVCKYLAAATFFDFERPLVAGTWEWVTFPKINCNQRQMHDWQQQSPSVCAPYLLAGRNILSRSRYFHRLRDHSPPKWKWSNFPFSARNQDRTNLKDFNFGANFKLGVKQKEGNASEALL